MTHETRPEPPLDDWRILWGGREFEGIEGVAIINNVANFKLTETGHAFTTPDPIWGQVKTFDVYDLTKSTGEVIQVALCEVSAGVYATAVRDVRKPF